MTFDLNQNLDCDIKKAEDICLYIFKEKGYSVKSDNNHLTFLRKSNKQFDRFMPIIELAKGFGEGNMTIYKQGDSIKVRIKHKWFMHIFSTLILLLMISFIAYLIARREFNIIQPIIALITILPLSIDGYLAAKRELNFIFRKASLMLSDEYEMIK